MGNTQQKADRNLDAEFLGDAKGSLSHTVIEILAYFWKQVKETTFDYLSERRATEATKMTSASAVTYDSSLVT